MTKKMKYDNKGISLTAEGVLKEVEVIEENFQQGCHWLDQLNEPVQNATDQCLQIISELNEIVDLLKKKQRKSTQKSTNEPMPRKVQAKLNKTLNWIVALSAVLEKRNRDAARISDCLFNEFEDNDRVVKNLMSIKRALKH